MGVRQPPGSHCKVSDDVSSSQGARQEELTLCKYYKEMGRCPMIDCNFAHGKQDLAQRERELECALWMLSD